MWAPKPLSRCSCLQEPIVCVGRSGQGESVRTCIPSPSSMLCGLMQPVHGKPDGGCPQGCDSQKRACAYFSTHIHPHGGSHPPWSCTTVLPLSHSLPVSDGQARRDPCNSREEGWFRETLQLSLQTGRLFSASLCSSPQGLEGTMRSARSCPCGLPRTALLAPRSSAGR